MNIPTNNDMKVCPECVNEFLESNPVEELGDEVFALHERPYSYGPNGCNHNPVNVFEQLAKARKATEELYRRAVSE